MKTKIDVIWVIVGLIIAFVLMRQCEGEPKTITKTETKTIIKTDTIKKVIIKEIPKTVYVEKLKTVKGKDSIIYKDKPDSTTIKANQYKTTLESNNALADLNITTTGELLDVSGTITYPEKETTTTITKIRDASGFYIYGQLPINNLTQIEVGGLFQFKNKAFISGGVSYNNITKQPDFNIGLGIRL